MMIFLNPISFCINIKRLSRFLSINNRSNKYLIKYSKYIKEVESLAPRLLVLVHILPAIEQVLHDYLRNRNVWLQFKMVSDAPIGFASVNEVKRGSQMTIYTL